MEELSNSEKADNIIRNHVVMAMGAGVIPVLIADVIAVTAMQMDMVKQLSELYGIPYEKNRTKAIIGSLTATALARAGARSLVKLIPGVGWVLGGVSVSAFAGASTYALGKLFKKHLESGGSLMDFDPKGVKEVYRELLKKGKDMLPWHKKEPHSLDDQELNINPWQDASVTKRLREISEWYESGLLSAEEFQRLKEKLLASNVH